MTTVDRFRELHESGCFVLPNAWDPGTAVTLAKLGFPAIASTSAGYAFSRGRADGDVPVDEMLEHLRDLVTATDVPVNADFQDGYGDSLAENVTACVRTGVAGLSIEDSSGRALYPSDVALERVRAARAAIDATGVPVVLTARCEAYLVGQPDPQATVLERLTAFAEAGADCLYAPGLSTADQIAAVVAAVTPRPVNVLASPSMTVAALADLGVRRISVGSGLARAAWSGFLRTARTMATDGSFAGLADATPFAELNESFSAGS